MAVWHWKTFDELTTSELYEILRIRQQVFTVEQQCAYQDADGRDQQSWHFFAASENSEETTSSGLPENQTVNGIHAYLRVLPPGCLYKEASLGRVLTMTEHRGKGLGQQLVKQALSIISEELPGHDVRISAQLYLEKFYTEFGFTTVSDHYLEDGIAHIEMLAKTG